MSWDQLELLAQLRDQGQDQLDRSSQADTLELVRTELRHARNQLLMAYLELDSLVLQLGDLADSAAS